jgi:hypothetical protein
MFVADRKAVRGGSVRKLTVQTGNLPAPGADLRYVAIEPDLSISGTPADPGGVTVLSRQLARHSLGAAHEVRSHVKT